MIVSLSTLCATGPAELRIPEPFQLLCREVRLAALGVAARVYVERQERRSKGGTAPVDREVPFLLQRLEDRKLLAGHAVHVRLARLELDALGLNVRHDLVNHPVQIGQAVARLVPGPVARVAPQDQAVRRDPSARW